MAEHEPRRVLLLTHTGRDQAVEVARERIALLTDAGIRSGCSADEAEALELDPVEIVDDPDDRRPTTSSWSWCSAATARSCAAAELARPHGTPLLGVNLGHVGFLAEAEGDDSSATVERDRRSHATPSRSG